MVGERMLRSVYTSSVILTTGGIFWIACQRSNATIFLPEDTPFCQSPSPSLVITSFCRGALFSPADRRRASGSGAGSAVTSSGPEDTPRDPLTTELSPDTAALVQRSVNPASTQAFEAGRQSPQREGLSVDMATFSTWRNTTERVVWHDETTQKATFEVVDNATEERYFYSEVTTAVTTRQVVRIDPTGENSAQVPLPRIMGIPSYDRTSTAEETIQVSGNGQKTKKPKYSSNAWGSFGLRG